MHAGMLGSLGALEFCINTLERTLPFPYQSFSSHLYHNYLRRHGTTETLPTATAAHHTHSLTKLCSKGVLLCILREETRLLHPAEIDACIAVSAAWKQCMQPYVNLACVNTYWLQVCGQSMSRVSSFLDCISCLARKISITSAISLFFVQCRFLWFQFLSRHDGTTFPPLVDMNYHSICWWN